MVVTPQLPSVEIARGALEVDDGPFEVLVDEPDVDLLEVEVEPFGVDEETEVLELEEEMPQVPNPGWHPVEQ